MVSLGQKIRELRIRKGLTQQELGSGIVTISMISQIESDKAYPSHRVLEQIAARLETPIEYFVADMQTQMEQNSLYKLAKSYLAGGQVTQAIPLLKELLQNPAPHFAVHEVQYDLAEAYLQQGNLERAVALFEQVLDAVIRKGEEERTVRCLDKLGEARYRQEHYPLALYHWRKAHEAITRAKDIDPFVHASTLSNLGRALQQVGEHKEALPYFREAQQLLKGGNNLRELATVYLGLGVSSKNLGDYNRAIEYCHDALTLFESLQQLKQTIDVRANFAYVQAEQGDVEAAIQTLHQCLAEYRRQDLVCEDAQIHWQIARLYLQTGKLREAEMFCQESLFLLPDDAKNLGLLYHALSSIKREQEEFTAAIDWLRRAIAAYEEQNQRRELRLAYQELADLYERLGDYVMTTETLRQMHAVLDDSLKKIGILV
ncbi:MAG TPA: tetratricopeptide repeat protein [Bacilli bacterium]|nr:tetratricopeptide repeat protein [Bacilli bacterium]